MDESKIIETSLKIAEVMAESDLTFEEATEVIKLLEKAITNGLVDTMITLLEKHNEKQ